MSNTPGMKSLRQCLDALSGKDLSPLDFLADGSIEEKIVGLELNGPPSGVSNKASVLFHETLARLAEMRTDRLRVVTIGGGTGLSNIVGGDSRREDWGDAPFTGLKEIFPGISSIVCVTDDGGSTGELLKYLPLVGLGDLRHVLVSSIRRERLQELYGLDGHKAVQLAAVLCRVFNHRFHAPDISPPKIMAEAGITRNLPEELFTYLDLLVNRLFHDPRLRKTLAQAQCLGNLLLASSIFSHVEADLPVQDLLARQQDLHRATMAGLQEISGHIGVHEDGVLPCTTTPAQLQMFYDNGVLVTGEEKSAHAGRGYPVDRAIVKFCSEPFLPPEVERVIGDADMLIYAPGSLYTSIIPILQVPRFAELIRKNRKALKILVSNIWVQKGETDTTRDAPERKFHVSDLIRAYNRNIPGGVANLFNHVLSLDLAEIPGSVLQNYALEEKEPIYLDREHLREIGFEPVEAGIFSTEKLQRRKVIQHDPAKLARAVRTLWCLHHEIPRPGRSRQPNLPDNPAPDTPVVYGLSHPCLRFEAIEKWLAGLTTESAHYENGTRNGLDQATRARLFAEISAILWQHSDILPEHLGYTRGIVLVAPEQWRRCQEWDNIFSFYDPDSSLIVIREDQAVSRERFAMAFLIALGQSLLGNYALDKAMGELQDQGEQVGRIYRLTVRKENEYRGFLAMDELDQYLRLARMHKSLCMPDLYTRLVNSEEGFTPPGLLFGLFYTWYLDNRFAGHIEYKMSIMRNTVSNLIPEQVKIVGRRKRLVDFFRERVFRHHGTLSQDAQ